MQIQRASKAHIHRGVNEVNPVTPVFQELDKLVQEYRTVGQRIEVIPYLIAPPILRGLSPHGDIEHLEHSLFDVGKLIKIHIIQPRQQVQQEGNPAAGIRHSQPCHGFGQCFLQRFGKVVDHIRASTQAGKCGKFVDTPGVQMVILQEVGERQLHAGIFLKRGDTGHQPGAGAIGRPYIVQYVFCGLLLQLYVAALWHGDEAVLDLAGHAAGSIGEQRSELVLKVILSVGLADKVENGQAFFILRQTQAAAQLLKEDGQGFRGAQEQHGIDLGNVHALVVDIHDKDEPHFAGHETVLGVAPFLVGGFTGQEHGRNAVLIEIPAHKFRVLHRDAEAKALDFIDVRHIFQKGGHDQIRTAIGDHAAERIDFRQLRFIITARRPFQLVEVYGIGHTEVLEGAKQLAVYGLRQPNLGRNAVIKIAENALAIHALRRGGQAQQNLRLIVFQQLLIRGRCRVVELVHDDGIIEIR